MRRFLETTKPYGVTFQKTIFTPIAVSTSNLSITERKQNRTRIDKPLRWGLEWNEVAARLQACFFPQALTLLTATV